MINTISESLNARIVFQQFIFNEQLKFHAKLRGAKDESL